MKEAKSKYNTYMGKPGDDSVKTWCRDIAIDGIETTTEAASFFAPGFIIASSLINFLVEIPIDANSRNKYYSMGDEAIKMFDDIDKKDS